MDAETRAGLRAKAHGIGDAGDWLGLSDAERKRVESRVHLARAIHAERKAKGLTQAWAAKLLGTSQSRFAAIEMGLPSGTSLDLMVSALFALDGDLARAIAGGYPPAPKRKARSKAES